MSSEFEFFTEEIKDPAAQESHQKVANALRDNDLVAAPWKFMEIAITGAVTSLAIPHGLSYVPKDIIQTSLTGAGSLTWIYDKFDATNLYLTTTGTLTVRCFIGRFFDPTTRATFVG